MSRKARSFKFKDINFKPTVVKASIRDGCVTFFQRDIDAWPHMDSKAATEFAMWILDAVSIIEGNPPNATGQVAGASPAHLHPLVGRIPESGEKP